MWDTFIQAVTMLRPGGVIGNVNYLGEGDYIRIPRSRMGAGMAQDHRRRPDARQDAGGWRSSPPSFRPNASTPAN